VPDRLPGPLRSRDRPRVDRLVRGTTRPTEVLSRRSLRGVVRSSGTSRRSGLTQLWIGPCRQSLVRGPPGQRERPATTVMDHTSHARRTAFGTDADLHALVSAALARGMKVYLEH